MNGIYRPGCPVCADASPAERLAHRSMRYSSVDTAGCCSSYEHTPRNGPAISEGPEATIGGEQR